MYMNTGIKKISLLVSFLIIFVFLAGCSEDTSSSNATTPTTLSTTVPSTTAAYSTGDVIKNPQAPSQTALLIISYNSSTDKYERAYIYPNADGSWGYRVNMNTEKVSRVIIDQLYTQKVTKITPSLVPVRTHAITSTPTSTASSATTATTVTTTTVTPTGKPSFKKIVPDEGNAGEAIPITALTGTNFKSGATVTLMKEDSPNITATNVNVQSPTLMTCTFTPPANTTAGAWDVVITNPDGQYVRYSYIFSIHASVNPDTTTLSTSGGITSVSPTFTYGNDIAGGMRVIGTNFQQGFTAKMVKSTGTNVVIVARSERWDSETQATCWFTIPLERQRGTYNVIITNPDGSIRSLQNGFEVK